MIGKAEVNAMAKGMELAGTVERVRLGLYLVPSQTEPGVKWPVLDVKGEGLRCSCPAALYGRPCAHVAAVFVRRQVEDEKRRVRRAFHRLPGERVSGAAFRVAA